RRVALGWHRATAGLDWRESPGWTGRALLHRLQAAHPNMPAVEALDDETAISVSREPTTVTRTDFVNPGIALEIGDSITSADVNNQFLANAKMAMLGDGAPTEVPVRHLDMVLKHAGYVF